MAPRHKRICSNCPKPKAAEAPIEVKFVTPPMTFEMAEASRLWRHVLFGTGTCVSMISGYADMYLPGCPIEDVIQLRDQLSRVISRIRDHK